MQRRRDLVFRVVGSVLAIVCALVLFWATRSKSRLASARISEAAEASRSAVLDSFSARAASDRQAAAEELGLSGVVLSSTGARKQEPLPGASVCVVSSDPESVGDCVTTNSEGRFTLGSEHCDARTRLVASAPGYASVTRVVATRSSCTGEHLVLALEPGGVEVAGRVVDATGGVVAGARVVAREASASESSSIALSADDGSFRLSAPEGMVELVATAEAYSRASRTLIAPQQGVVLALAPASAIVGDVVLESGEAVAGAHVTATNRTGVGAPTRSVEADSAGHFVVGELVAGGYEVFATTDRLRTAAEWVTVAIAERASTQLVAISASSLRAEVLVDGSPCSSGRVTLRGPTGSERPIDPVGKIRFEGLSRGRYEASIRCTSIAKRHPNPGQRGQTIAELEEVVIVDQQAVTANWSLTEAEPSDEPSPAEAAATTRTGSISGQVLDEDGNPVPEAWVTAAGPSGSSGNPSLTDVSGGFAVTGLAEGTYELSASSSLGEGRASRVALDASNVRIRVGLYGAIFGSVQATDGTPVDVFTLVYHRKDQADIRALNGAQGRWSLPWLPAGHYRLSAIASAGCGWADAQLNPGGTARVAISLDQSGEICSTIWQAGAPVDAP